MMIADKYDPKSNTFTLSFPGCGPITVHDGRFICYLHDALRAILHGWHIQDVVVTTDDRALVLIERLLP